MTENQHKRSGLRSVREIALTVGAVAGVICIIATLAALFFGIIPLIFRSGSMSPTINTGALALADTVPATEVQVGDVISIDDGQGGRLTHRVVSVDSVTGNTAVVQLKGDANEEADVEPYAITSADRVFFHIDGLGYFTAWLSRPTALVVGGLVAGLLIFTAFWPNGRRPEDDTPGGSDGDAEGSESSIPEASDTEQESTEVKKSRTLPHSPIVLGVALLTLVGFAEIPGTSAAFTDTASANSGAFAARADFVPPINTGVTGSSYFVDCDSLGSDRIRVRWSHLGPPWAYKIAIRTLNNPTYIETSYDVVPPVGAVTGDAIVSDFGPFNSGAFAAFGFDFEIHTLLPSSGAVGSLWRGTRINRPPFYSTNARCGTPLGSNIPVDKSGNDFVPDNPPATFARQRQSLAQEPGGETTSATTTPEATTTPPVTSGPSATGTTTPGATTSGATTTTPSPTTTTPNVTTTTSPDVTTTTPSATTTTPTPTEAALTPPVTSSSGNYVAQTVQSDSGPSAVIKDGANEVYRTAVSATDTVEWVKGTDDLRITTPSKVWLVSTSSGKWVKTEVVPPAVAPAPTSEEKKLPPAEEPKVAPPAEPSTEESAPPTS